MDEQVNEKIIRSLVRKMLAKPDPAFQEAFKRKKEYESQQEKKKEGQPRNRLKRWHKGETPTGRETLAAIYRSTLGDGETRQRLNEAFVHQQENKKSPFYNPYRKPTFRAEKETLGANQAFLNSEQQTGQAEKEWEKLREELGYWAIQGNDDEDTLRKINWNEYPVLKAMEEGKKAGNPIKLTRPVGYSQDNIYGTMWAARNSGGTGDPQEDALQSALSEKERTYLEDLYEDAPNYEDELANALGYRSFGEANLMAKLLHYGEKKNGETGGIQAAQNLVKNRVPSNIPMGNIDKKGNGMVQLINNKGQDEEENWRGVNQKGPADEQYHKNMPERLYNEGKESVTKIHEDYEKTKDSEKIAQINELVNGLMPGLPFKLQNVLINMEDSERLVLFSETPINAFRLAKAYMTADEMPNKYFPSIEINSETILPTNMDGTLPNAFKHAYWNCLMAYKTTPELAEAYANAHEENLYGILDNEYLGDTIAAHCAMDLYYNKLGRDIAENMRGENVSDEALAEIIFNAVMEDQSHVLIPNMDEFKRRKKGER